MLFHHQYIISGLRNANFNNLPSEPPLTEAERAIVKSYGGWTQFMICFGLKPWEFDDVDEGKQILAAFVADDEDEVDEDKDKDEANKKQKWELLESCMSESEMSKAHTPIKRLASTFKPSL